VVEQLGKLEALIVAEFVSARMAKLDAYIVRGICLAMLGVAALVTIIVLAWPLNWLVSSSFQTPVRALSIRPVGAPGYAVRCGPAPACGR
jgi:hypothetical protein